MKIFVFGAGKVGRALALALRKAGHNVTLRAARKGLPKRQIATDLLILALRDRDLNDTAAEIARRALLSSRAICVHVAGALDVTPLEPLRGKCAGVAQMHPMISFASPSATPSLTGGHVHVRGDAAAEAIARRAMRSLGMTPRTFSKLDTTAYHAAAGLVANGAAALAAVGTELLAHAGAPRKEIPKMLGPLLRSVAENVERLGLPDALTGPVRRGDARGVKKHLEVLKAKYPDAVGLYLASARAQLPLARSLGEAETGAFDEIEALVNDAGDD